MDSDGSFGDLVASFAEVWLGGGAKNYVAATERLQEADRVDSLVRQFAMYELRPPPSGPLRSIGSARVGPTLGQVLGPRLDSADQQVSIGVLEAIVRAIATGYGCLASLEPEVPEALGPIEWVANRSAPSIWAFWLSNFRGDVMKEFDVPPDVRKRVHEIAESELLSGLDRIGMKPRLRGRTRLGVLGFTYGDAGATLRMAQTSAVSDTRLSKNSLGFGVDVKEVLLRWPLLETDAPMQDETRYRAIDETTHLVVLGAEAAFAPPKALREELLGLIESGKRLVVDLSYLPWTDETELGVLVAAVKRARELGRERAVVLVVDDENFTQIFETTGLDRVFPIYTSRRDGGCPVARRT